MSNYVNDLNDLITAKSEIKNIIQDTLNENPSEVFSYYPSYIARIAASSEGPYVVSYSYLSENYPDFTYLYAYVADAVESGGGSVDLSSYVTYAYLASKDYVDYNTFNGLENEVYLDEDDGGSGTFKASLKDVLEESGLIYEADTNVFDVMDIQSTIDSTVEDYLTNSSYITIGDVSACGYITSGDVSQMGYITASDLPVVNENLIPKETNTYTLGDASHLYAATYTTATYFNGNAKITGGNDITLYASGLAMLKVGNKVFRPDRTGVDLGSSDKPWNVAYINTAYLQDTSYTKTIVPAETDTYTLGDSSNLYDTSYTNNIFVGTYHSFRKNGNSNQSFYVNINGNNRYVFSNNGFFPAATNRTLGQDTSTGKWQSTYTTNIYADNAYISNIYNFIWTGTAAQYASLDNYTSYQIYMIKES